MCGRYNILPDAQAWLDAFCTAHDIINELAFEASYNICPSHLIPVIRRIENSLVLSSVRWGFVPHWVKEAKPKIQPANARSDGIATKPYFRESFKQRRCVLPASGFYEWKTQGRLKQPYNIRMKDQQPFFMAGIWDTWGGEPRTCLITTEANELMAPIHDRQVAIIPHNRLDEWLKGAHPEEFLQPCPAALMEAYPVSVKINKPDNNSSDLLDPIPER